MKLFSKLAHCSAVVFLGLCSKAGSYAAEVPFFATRRLAAGCSCLRLGAQRREPLPGKTPVAAAVVIVIVIVAVRVVWCCAAKDYYSPRGAFVPIYDVHKSVLT